MKKIYVSPIVEIEKFADGDVITTSGLLNYGEIPGDE